MLEFYMNIWHFFCAQWHVILKIDSVPSVKNNIKLVAVAYNVLPAGFEHKLYSILGHLSLVIMEYLCEILLKIVQNFFHCVPDRRARNLVKVAK